MYRPLSGSFANACTETKIPDLTKNVPRRLKENVSMDNKMLQLINIPLFSETIKECNNAVIANQGIKDAFSTGSQNHQPPQPNSWYAHQLPREMPIVKNIHDDITHFLNHEIHSIFIFSLSKIAIAKTNGTLVPT